MRNQVDFHLPPEDLFLNPAQDPGLAALGPLEWFWRPREPAKIVAFPASEYPEITERIEVMIRRNLRHKRFGQAVEFNTVPVELTSAAYKRSYVTASGRCLLSGASGSRLLNRWNQANRGTPAQDDLIRYFTRSQNLGPERHFLRETTLADDTPFAVECRNSYNYYHFLTESLGQLNLLDDIGGDRPVFLHFPNKETETRGFVRDFIQALYPEYADRVTLQRSPKRYERVAAPYNLTISYFHYGDELVDSLDGLVDSSRIWKGRRAVRAAQDMLAMNAVDANLIRLRERGLRAIEGMDFSYLPRRFYIRRLPGHARDRKLRGEEGLLELLRPFGFEALSFENLSPLEQIGLMANAEMMVASHGAGFANMLFANPAAQLVEIGTLETAIFAWRDFWTLANASGCSYINFFADYDLPDPLVDPVFGDDGVVPGHLGPTGMEKLMGFLTTSLGHIAHYDNRGDILRLAGQMNEIGAHRRTVALFDRHRGVEDGDAELCRALAEAHRRLGNGPAELAALEKARAAEPDSAAAARQLVWCARDQGDGEALARALGVLQKSFPEEYLKLEEKGRRWLQRLA